MYKKPGYLPEKLKLWRDSTTIEFNIFLLKLCAPFHQQYLPKDVRNFFLFFLDLELLINLFLWVFENLVFFILANKSRSKHKTNPKYPFVDIGK